MSTSDDLVSYAANEAKDKKLKSIIGENTHMTGQIENISSSASRQMKL